MTTYAYFVFEFAENVGFRCRVVKKRRQQFELATVDARARLDMTTYATEVYDEISSRERQRTFRRVAGVEEIRQDAITLVAQIAIVDTAVVSFSDTTAQITRMEFGRAHIVTTKNNNTRLMATFQELNYGNRLSPF